MSINKVDSAWLQRHLPSVPLELRNEILEHGQYVEVESNTEILREGQYIRSVPLVLEGLIKVYNSFEDKELLLYYIEAKESCIMSFSAALSNSPSQIYALAEKPTRLFLLPIKNVQSWLIKYPVFNLLFYQEYNRRYSDLLQTIQQVLFMKMDVRLLHYLRVKSQRLGTPHLDLRHHEIAQELGTAREVISRVMKKLEADDKVRQHHSGIELLDPGD